MYRNASFSQYIRDVLFRYHITYNICLWFANLRYDMYKVFPIKGYIASIRDRFRKPTPYPKLDWDTGEYLDDMSVREVDGPCNVHREPSLGKCHYVFEADLDNPERIIARCLELLDVLPTRIADGWGSDQIGSIIDDLLEDYKNGTWHGETRYYVGDWGSYTVSREDSENVFCFTAYRGTKEVA